MSKWLITVVAAGLVVVGTGMIVPLLQGVEAGIEDTVEATVGTPTLDGIESVGEWTSNSVTNSRGLIIKAMVDSERFYLMARWPDPTMTAEKDRWTFDGVEWTSSGGEDSVVFLWEMSDAEGNVLNGTDGADCATMCHVPHMRTNLGRVDLWHWQSSRTNPMGFSEDGYLDPGTVSELNGRHGDTGRGTDSRNRSADRTRPRFMAAGDPGANVSFLNEAEPQAFDPFAVAPGTVDSPVPFDETALFSVGDSISGRVLTTPTGNESSVRAAGRWSEGWWTVEFSRARAEDFNVEGIAEDFAIVPGGTVRFSAEVMDNVGEAHWEVDPDNLDTRVYSIRIPVQTEFNEIYFAQFADGAGLFSLMTLSSRNAGADTEATIILRDNDGQPLTVDLNGTVVTGELVINIPPSGLAFFETDSLGDVVIGSVTVRSTNPISGVLLFGGSLGLAGVGASPRFDNGFTTPIETSLAGGIDTGVALQNLSEEAITTDLELLDAGGTVVSGAVGPSLAAFGHAAQFVTEFTWDPPVDLSSFRGTLRVTSSGAVTATALQQRPGQFATLPVVAR